MYCKRCTHLYSLDLKQDNSIFLNCSNCGNDENIPIYIQTTFEIIFYINKKIEIFFCN